MLRLLALVLGAGCVVVTGCGAEHPAEGFDDVIWEKVAHLQAIAEKEDVSTKSVHYGRIVDEIDYAVEGERKYTAGLCSRFDDGTRGVLVRKQFSIDSWVFNQTVYHELGHCMLELPHDSTMLMREGEISIGYRDNLEEMLLEMVRKRKEMGPMKQTPFFQKFLRDMRRGF